MSSFFLPSKPQKGDRKRKRAQLNVWWALIRNYIQNYFVQKKKASSVPQKKKLPVDNEEIASDSEVEELSCCVCTAIMHLSIIDTVRQFQLKTKMLIKTVTVIKRKQHRRRE